MNRNLLEVSLIFILSYVIEIELNRYTVINEIELRIEVYKFMYLLLFDFW